VSLQNGNNRTGSRPPKRRRAAAPALEALESRRLLAAAAPASIDGGVSALGESSASLQLSVAPAAVPTDLALDPTFGTGGVADVPYLPDSGIVAVPVVLAAQPDGKVLVGYYNNLGHVRVRRFNADGTPDAPFNTTVANALNDRIIAGAVAAVAVLPGGKILLGLGGFGAVKLNPDGTLDRTFGDPGNEGTARLPIGGRLHDMFVRPDGRIVFIGDDGARALVVGSMTASGQPDRTFGITATRTYDLPAGNFFYQADAAGALAPDGKVVVAGNIEYSRVAVVRFNTDGTLDSTFAPTALPNPALDNVADVAVQDDGKVLLAGSNGLRTGQHPGFGVARLLPNGTADASFGTGGVVHTEVAGPAKQADAQSILLLPDGRILASGRASDPSNPDGDDAFIFAAYRPDGRLDLSFSNGGVGSFNPSPRDRFRDAVRLPDGSVVVLGEVDNFTHGTLFKFVDLKPPGIVGRQVFYNQSVFDGNNAAAGPADNNAIATDKVALLPGQAASFANVTTYTRGINGLMIDVRGMADPTLLGSASSFWTDPAGSPDPSQWAPAPAPTTVVLRRGGGPGGSDRVTLIWPDGAIRNTWLHVTLRSARTGLPADDVFSFANLIGEAGDGTLPARVNALDVAAVKRALNTDAAIDSRVDFNRDGRVNALDVAAVKQNLGHTLAAPAPALLPASNDSTRLWDELRPAILD
jgi:uncharacterized delta-60 repeat protein